MNIYHLGASVVHINFSYPQESGLGHISSPSVRSHYPRYFPIGFWARHQIQLIDGGHENTTTQQPLRFHHVTRENNSISSSSSSGDRWEGKAIVPSAYLPANVSAFNMFAIHKATLIEEDQVKFVLKILFYQNGKSPHQMARESIS